MTRDRQSLTLIRIPLPGHPHVFPAHGLKKVLLVGQGADGFPGKHVDKARSAASGAGDAAVKRCGGSHGIGAWPHASPFG